MMIYELRQCDFCDQKKDERFFDFEGRCKDCQPVKIENDYKIIYSSSTDPALPRTVLIVETLTNGEVFYKEVPDENNNIINSNADVL